MKEPCEVIEYKEFKINIHQDESSESPREWGNLGKMICFHSRYDLGDKKENSFDGNTPSAFLFGLADQVDPNVDKVNYDMTEKIRDKLLDKYYIILPLYLYNHSGITMSTERFSCPWDSGQVGYILVSIEDVKKEYKWKVLTKERRQLIEDVLRSEVKTFDCFLRGNIYGYIIIDPKGEERDSCWGFFDYNHEESGLLDSAREFIDWIRGDEDEAHNPVAHPSL